MCSSDLRQFASDLRKAQDLKSDAAMPEWKVATQGRNVSMGKRTNLSIKEQRETLPVFQFRQQLLDAVRDNQLMIVVGETG